MSSESKNPSFFVNFVSGGIALSSSFAITHPLDTLKTQIQTKTVDKSLRGLGRGFLPSYLLAAPQGGLRLSTYELIKTRLLDSGWSVGAASAAAACVGDTASSIVKVPREVITSRVQSGIDLCAGSLTSSSMASIKAVLDQQGPKGFFRGFWSTTARDWPFMVILFSTYESLKQHHLLFTLSSSPADQITFLKSTVFGGFSGSLAGFLTTPFDVIKTRIMTAKVITRASSPNMWKVSKSVAMEEGFTGYFRGGGARSVWWFVHCTFTLF